MLAGFGLWSARCIVFQGFRVSSVIYKVAECRARDSLTIADQKSRKCKGVEGPGIYHSCHWLLWRGWWAAGGLATHYLGKCLLEVLGVWRSGIFGVCIGDDHDMAWARAAQVWLASCWQRTFAWRYRKLPQYQRGYRGLGEYRDYSPKHPEPKTPQTLKTSTRNTKLGKGPCPKSETPNLLRKSLVPSYAFQDLQVKRPARCLRRRGGSEP